MKNILDRLKERQKELNGLMPFPNELISNLREWFRIELTYTSNAIEGNTLSRAETAMVVEKGIVVEGKTLREHLEAVNHAQAFDWILQKVDSAKQEITEQTILDLHQLILQKLVDNQAGRYRTVPVRIAGSTVIMPNAMKVPELMNAFVSWLQNSTDDPLVTAVDAHFKLVSIHPFVDGNGRTARLLMNLILMQNGYPPAIIRKEDRRRYISSIEKAQLGGSLSDYYFLMYEAVERSLDIYVDSLKGTVSEVAPVKGSLLKIGELAKLVDETVPTIRHWTREGLLQVATYTQGGYQLYDKGQVETIERIRKLQNKDRLTIAEIKKELAKR